ncbi:ATP-NAD kinase-like domain-containing protein [Crepidotus variabilis]|uniref:ATP-NAD kinase-like domain-containing protein n=1 Tax=Crepidotus variabilis TaxID=179855 RepID=A0A9P6JTJ3_9AGAR|nr:ATP-NAD kinase-like domain-containing protein [Crepidotus variabilis]
MMVSVVINPVCGHKDGLDFYSTHVANKFPENTKYTTNQDLQFLLNDKPETIVVASGDGTLHEIINYLAAGGHLNVAFVLLPCGTANALYASLFSSSSLDQSTPEYRLQSLNAYLQQKAPKHLSLATTSIAFQSTIASVVVSTSLHASILHDSEALREQHPGIERFKIAAQQNSTKWYKSVVKLSATASSPVQVYDSISNSFINHPDANPDLTLQGPFVYFLSTFNVDRLEPAFRIAPLMRSIPPTGPSCDVVIVRPLRDPSITSDTPEARAAFQAKTWKILTEAYQDGAHVRLKYNHSGELSEDGEGITAVEYLRCGGWEWIPDSNDSDAHLVCADGAILNIPQGGKSACTIDTSKHQYSVYA